MAQRGTNPLIRLANLDSILAARGIVDTVGLATAKNSDKEPGIATFRNSDNSVDFLSYEELGDSMDMVTKSTVQTITRQKNFMGTVKFRSDSSFQLNPSGLPNQTLLGVTQLSSHTTGKSNIFHATSLNPYNAPYSLQIADFDFIPDSIGSDFTLTYGYNLDGTKSDRAVFSMNMESAYEVNANYDVYEWFLQFLSSPYPWDYSARPIQVGCWIPQDGVSRTYSTFVIAADEFSVSANDSWQKFRINPTLEGTNTQFVLMDSTYLLGEVNNIPVYTQASTLGGVINLIGADDDDEVVVSPNGVTPIKLPAPLSTSIRWRNNANNDNITILPDSSDRLNINSAGGVGVQSLDITYIPDDTLGLPSGKLYLDPNTGNVKYTIPENLVTNGDFSSWYDYGTYRMPTDWIPPDTSLGMYVEEDPSGKAHIVSDGTSTAQFYYNATLQEVGVTYGYSFTVYEPVDSFYVFMTGWSDMIREARTYTGEWTSTDAQALVSFASHIGTPQEITVDNIRVWVKNGSAKETLLPTLYVPDTVGVTDGYVPKYVSGEIIWSPDIATAGSGLFNPDGTTIDTTAGGLARVLPAKVTKWDSVSVKQNADSDLDNPDIALSQLNETYQAIDSDLDNPDVALDQLDESYSAVGHTHTEFADTIPIYFGVMDTVTTGDYIPIKIPNNYTVVEVSASCNTGSVTFNIEERAETTPYSAGTDIMTSDLVADPDQQETTTFSNASLAKNNRVCLVVTSITGDPTIFEVSMFVIKTN